MPNKQHVAEDRFVEDLMSVDVKPNQFMDYLDDKSHRFKIPFRKWIDMSSFSEGTANACESFNGKCNKSFYTPHLDIFSIIEKS